MLYTDRENGLSFPLFVGFSDTEILDTLGHFRDVHVGQPSAQALIAGTVIHASTRSVTTSYLLFHCRDNQILSVSWHSYTNSKYTRTWGWKVMRATLNDIWSWLAPAIRVCLYRCPRFRSVGDQDAATSDGLLAAMAIMDTVTEKQLLTTLEHVSRTHEREDPGLQRLYTQAWQLYLDDCNDGRQLWCTGSGSLATSDYQAEKTTPRQRRR